MNIVEFKSDKEFFEKEKSGIKNNTVRFRDNDKRFDILDRFNQEDEFYIVVVNRQNKNYFVREIKDVSIYNNIYIISFFETELEFCDAYHRINKKLYKMEQNNQNYYSEV